MGFEVIENEIRTIWAPLDCANSENIVYQGSIVMANIASDVPAGEGLRVIGAAAGASDTTGSAVPFGVVLGFNDSADTATYNSTYKGASATVAASTTQAIQVARKFSGVEGMSHKGDPWPMAQVAVIGPSTILKGRLFNGAYGTVLPTYANTTQSTTGATVTTSAVSFTPIAYNSAWYCTSGKNRGLYRTAYSTSTTSHTFYQIWPYDIEVGDVFRPAAVRQVGTSMIQFDAYATYIEMSSVAYSSNYYYVDILEVNLEKSGEEYVIFKFNADQFCAVRA